MGAPRPVRFEAHHELLPADLAASPSGPRNPRQVGDTVRDVPSLLTKLVSATATLAEAGEAMRWPVLLM